MNLLHLPSAMENISYIFHYTHVLTVLNSIIILSIIGFGLYFINKPKSFNTNTSFSSIPTTLDNTRNNSIGISNSRKQDLIKQLIEFENSEFYLEKNISLAKLAIHLNTNTKYLSHVIKLHSDRDFNNYINLLRIQYVVNKLNDDPKFANYKISAIADEAGFSSHSKFTHFFKLNLGEAPSSYISKIKQNKSYSVERI